MHGRHPHFQPRGGGRGEQPPPMPQAPPPNLNPNVYFQNPNLFIQNPFFVHMNQFPQNPNILFQNPNGAIPTTNFNPIQVPIQPSQSHPARPKEERERSDRAGPKARSGIQTSNTVPTSTTNSSPNQVSNQRSQSQPVRPEDRDRIDRAVAKARSDLLAAGECVSAWEVSQLALIDLKAESWDSLGLQMQQVPSLNRLIITERKINAYIHSFVAVRRITSLHDLEVAICKTKGVERYEELELGPLVRHPLVMHYFCVGSDIKDIFEITSEEIICYLCEFIDSHKSCRIDVEEFLDFVAKKKSLSGREKLNVRIKSLGLHGSFIRQARRLENNTLKKCLEDLKQNSNRRLRKRPLLSKQKKQLDDHFNSIAQRIESFSSLHKDFGGKHIRFVSSSSEENDSEEYEDQVNKNDEDIQSHCNISQNTGSSNRASSCPYPSAAEEMSRLGLKVEISIDPSPANDGHGRSKRKRKSENLSNVTEPCKVPKTDKHGSDVTKEDREFISHDEASQFEADLSLDNNSMRMFIMMWKDACRVNSVAEIFRRMLQFYKPPRRIRARAVFSTYPFIGLLHVAVISIKRGMWDSMYDDLQGFAHPSLADTLSENCSVYESIEIEPAEKNTLTTIEHDLKCVTLDDIVQKVSSYFELDHNILSNVELSFENKLIFLRKLCKCEIWLTKQFSVEKFESLGFGEFFMFLKNHVCQLYSALQECLAGKTFKKSSFDVCMLEQQLALLLSQAAISRGGDEIITEEMISQLLMRQFPLVSFVLPERGSLKDFMDDFEKKESISTCVLFSATLLGRQSGNTGSVKESLGTGVMETKKGYETKTFGSFTTKDAIGVLLQAPLLSDLFSWTHWDIVFAPSLGPLVGWLLNEVNTKELLCLVTKDGKVIRIDHTASVDSFFEACLQGSSFQTAVKLLSLLSLYGGEAHVPLSLLKCHARQAFEVFMKNSVEVEINKNQATTIYSPYKDILDRDTSSFSFDLLRSNSTNRKEVYVASRFFINCLGHLPREFCAFAADVLLSGIQLIVKDAPSAILGECKDIGQRLLLHDVGLSLGIVEWIDDYHLFRSSTTNGSLISFGMPCLGAISPDSGGGCTQTQGESSKLPSSEGKMLVSIELDPHNKEFERGSDVLNDDEVSGGSSYDCCIKDLSENDKENEALMVIESIRREEFGLDPRISDMEVSMLKKQHARLGRALHCLSQELYSQDSHFLLELVQNADDNLYPENVEPTLTFILQESGIVVLNNERGFSAQNIRALCDVGSSTKKGATGGYIGKKGIGFKSVFRVTDAPEIHSNGFHVKFDITEGQIGFVLPTVVPRCDVDSYRWLASFNIDKTDAFCWNTSIVLPFRTKLSEDSSMNSIRLMFSDLHPSLLLFLHRLQCIRFRNIPDDTMVIMKKEIVGNGIVNVAFGKEKMTWFVASQVLQENVIRPDVHTTEISIAFPLQESGNGEYVPRLEQQPVFAFLPLRKYGLKFIIQGDFVLPSSREEVDGDSPWNQWLLEKFPDLFVSAEKSFCAFPCFRDNPGKAVSLFMGFVPLVGEVQGFFSSLPRLIISKLRSSKCLLMEGDREGWVLPCKVIRNWNDEAQNLLSNSYLHEHLGLRFLDRNIVLSDLLSRDLGIQEYGPSILVQLMASLCHSDKGIKSAGLVWLSSWLNALYTMLFNSSGQISLSSGTASDVINNLKKIPFVPLSDGSYSSVDEGTIWLHLDSFCPGSANDHYSDAFPILYAKLRTVSPALFSAAATVDISGLGMSIHDNVTRMLLRIGVQQLSAHEIVKVHILPAISDVRITLDDKIMMVEYLSFIMFHLQSSCPTCHIERGHIISELRDKALILTNYGYKRPTEVTMHFSKQFGNPVDISKLIHGMDLKWHDVEVEYLQHPITGSLPSSMRQWREFFQQIGVMDFVHVVSVEKSFTDISDAALKNMLWDEDRIPHGAVAKDWESPELVHLLSQLSLSSDRVRSQYLLEALDILWDDCFSDKVAGYCINNSPGDGRAFKSSFMSCLCGIRWVASSIDEELHYTKDLFYDCEAVRSVLGATAPYAVPKVKSEKLLSDIGLKTQVVLDDVLTALQVWRRSETPFMASITQMSKFYTFIWNEMAVSKHKIVDILNMGPFIFIPYSCVSRHEDLVLGGLFSPSEVHWHDFTGSVQQIEEIHHRHGSGAIDHPLCKSLCNIYPSLHAFFVNECGVKEIPHYRSYLQILLELSTVTLPSQTAKTVFQVFLQWSDGLKSGLLCSEDVIYLKGCLLKLEFTVLPTLLDKWVSLHPSFGLVCWCDDEKLKKEFKHLDKIEFLYFGELNDEEQEFLRSKVSFLMKTLGIPTLSDVITREAICYGLVDCSFKISLLNWALPYAQRYIYNTHRDRYFELKESGFQVLSQLRIVVVEKLFYRNIIEGANIASKKRFECNCLLQRNVLYATQETDSHSLFMELSRLLSDGTRDLHLANFLHMITTMAESGSNEEQTEFFILNSQKIPKLPDNESIWSLPSTPSSSEDYEALPITNGLTNSNEQNSTIYKRKPGISSNWPPVDWKTAPGFTYAYANGLNMQSNVSPPDSVMQVRKLDTSDIRTAKTDHEVPAEINANCAIECDPTAITAIVVLPDSQASEDQENMVDSVDLDTQCEGPKSEAFFPSGRDQHSHTAPNPQHVLTGRLGELVAFNYFSSNAGTGCVTWVNQDIETGLPYDLVIEDERKRVEYIEVKATRSSMKDWFHITLREWQYAVEKGDSFSIAHVILSANNVARINVFKNPARLCQLRKLHLAVVMPKSLQEFSITS